MRGLQILSSNLTSTQTLKFPQEEGMKRRQEAEHQNIVNTYFAHARPFSQSYCASPLELQIWGQIRVTVNLIVRISFRGCVALDKLTARIWFPLYGLHPLGLETTTFKMDLDAANNSTAPNYGLRRELITQLCLSTTCKLIYTP